MSWFFKNKSVDTTTVGTSMDADIIDSVANANFKLIGDYSPTIFSNMYENAVTNAQRLNDAANNIFNNLATGYQGLTALPAGYQGLTEEQKQEQKKEQEQKRQQEQEQATAELTKKLTATGNRRIQI